MGCGSSTAGGAMAPTSRDPEDFQLDHIEFKKLGIYKFDDFAANVADPVNAIVDIANQINDCITEVKDAAALVIGAYRLDIHVKDIKDHDKVLLTFTKADGTYATPEEVKALDAKAKTANEKLTKARLDLSKSLEKAPKSLTAGPDGALAAAEGAFPELTAFNTALAELKTAVGAGYKVGLSVVPAGVAGGQGLHAVLGLPVFKDAFSTSYEVVPIGLLEAAGTKQAKAIFAAEAGVAKAAGSLAKALKAIPAADYNLSVKGRKIMVTYPDEIKKKAEEKAAREARAAEGYDKPQEDEGEGDDDKNDDSKDGKPVGEGAEDDKDDEPADDEPAAADEPDAEDGRKSDGRKSDGRKSDGRKSGGKTSEDGRKSGGKTSEDGRKSGGKAAAVAAAAPKASKAKVDPLAKQKAELKRAVSNTNSEIFKLAKALQNVNGPVSLGKGVIALMESIKKWATEQSKNRGDAADISKMITVNPTIKTDESGELDFDLGILVTMPGEGELTLDKLICKLPGSVQLLHKAIFGIKDKITNMIPQFTNVKDEAMQLIESADQTFDNASETIKTHLTKADPMTIMKTIAAVPSNIMMIKDCAKTVQVFVLTVKRIADELNSSFEDLKKVAVAV